MGIRGLYVTSFGLSEMEEISFSEASSSDSSSSSPRSIEYRRWMIEMHTLLTGSTPPPARCCALYSSVNFRPSSGVAYC